MTLFEVGDVLGADLIVRRFANQRNRWSCGFESTMARDGNHGLVGNYGSGVTPSEAIADYVQNIRGRTLLAFMDSPTLRREVRVPDTLESWLRRTEAT